MNRRLILSAFLVLCLSTGLLAQGKLGVYAAAFYNLENLWDTEDNPDNPGDDDFFVFYFGDADNGRSGRTIVTRQL